MKTYIIIFFIVLLNFDCFSQNTEKSNYEPLNPVNPTDNCLNHYKFTLEEKIDFHSINDINNYLKNALGVCYVNIEENTIYLHTTINVDNKSADDLIRNVKLYFISEECIHPHTQNEYK